MGFLCASPASPLLLSKHRIKTPGSLFLYNFPIWITFLFLFPLGLHLIFPFGTQFFVGFSDYSKLGALISWDFGQPNAGKCKSIAATGVQCSCASMSPTPSEASKGVWVWSENRQVLTAAVERGWTTFLFSPHNRELAHQWSCKLAFALSSSE